jgi:hypothetical protein
MIDVHHGQPTKEISTVIIAQTILVTKRIPLLLITSNRESANDFCVVNDARKRPCWAVTRKVILSGRTTTDPAT